MNNPLYMTTKYILKFSSIKLNVLKIDIYRKRIFNVLLFKYGPYAMFNQSVSFYFCEFDIV